MRGSNKAGGASCGARDHGDDGGVAHFGAQASGIAARSGATESRSVGGRAVLPNGSPGLFAGPGGPANKKRPVLYDKGQAFDLRCHLYWPCVCRTLSRTCQHMLCL